MKKIITLLLAVIAFLITLWVVYPHLTTKTAEKPPVEVEEYIFNLNQQ